MATLTSVLTAAVSPGQTIVFNRDIRPILLDRCFRCHGPDEKAVNAGLRLDVAARAVRQLDSGNTAIVPGKPEQSELIQRVSSRDVDYRMPPPEFGAALTEGEIDLLKRWILQGAAYQRHWSFDPPTRPALPTATDSGWGYNAIDRFVRARLDQEGIPPAPLANRYALVRRVTLDLTGLPPSLQEVDRFVADRSRSAYEELVERQLNSPAFGERWARVWLDLARYADSAGYAQDPPRTIWKYRDWVIQAINANLPFDQFTIEQLAGDMLPSPTHEQRIATAFHRNTMTNSEGGTDDEEFRNAAIVDRVNTTMQVWMGLTVGCAQCHDHKFDPITQEEYFRLFAVLNNSEDADKGDERPTLETLTDQQKAKKTALSAEIASLQEIVAEQDNSTSASEASTPEQRRLEQLKKQLADVRGVTTPIMRELPLERRRKTHIQIRGNFLVKGREVVPGIPSAFHALRPQLQPDRLGLAKWLVDVNNPLTARVVVNRFWEQLFGTGLVETSEDFGRQGAMPSYPKLVDYLATELVRGGWDTKALLRTIVTSTTYRQSSRVTPELRERDPANRLLARGPRFRMSAEMIRDQALSVSGLLSHKMYGPSVRPPRPVLGLRAAFGASTDWETSAGEDRYRRGLYTRWRRTTPYPSMTTFDAPSREFCTLRRVRTNTPLQALVTLNDPVYVEAAQALARRCMAEGGNTDQGRAAHGFRLCLARTPSEKELEHILALYTDAANRFAQDPEAARHLATEPLGPAPDQWDVAELAAWTVVSNVLLNLDEFLARR